MTDKYYSAKLNIYILGPARGYTDNFLYILYKFLWCEICYYTRQLISAFLYITLLVILHVYETFTAFYVKVLEKFKLLCFGGLLYQLTVSLPAIGAYFQIFW